MIAAVRWALIGASTIADEWMVDAIRSQSTGVIDVVVSGSEARAGRFAEKHGIPRHSADLDAVLADPTIQAVYISSANEKHLPQILAAAKAGKHVLCEKPLALTQDDAAQMIEACAASNVVLGTNHHLRCAATHQRVREMIRAGAVGTPLYARISHAVALPVHLHGWRIERRDAGGGVVFDISVHDADTLRFVLDDEPVEVCAMTSSGTLGEGGLSDGVMAVIRFKRGLLAQIHDAFTVPYAPTGLEVHGTAGSIFARDVMTQHPIGEVRLCNAKGEQVIELSHANLYSTAVAQFHLAISDGQAPAATGADGYRSVVTAISIAKSAESGERVAVPSQYAF
ncbi:fructose reductase [Burkholderia vietnamiensis]|uniref:Gfo/Idh/MocA family protein n=1 Tax=Burkholderia vietnamiensis TaxID=60552 RepID=UPI00075F3F39|nr:Gfo/Idh/MocA family oxidoreductase [Burkholderia vietnamiensis]KVF24212.1 fructose reductase [Burkholderia vietnamiensis]